MLCKHSGGGGRVSNSNFPGKKRYEGVRFNVISVTRGWVGVNFPEKTCYATLEKPPYEWHGTSPDCIVKWSVVFDIVLTYIGLLCSIYDAI